jgi:putative inorganic carbon (hco3(-)) transporter
MLSSRHSSSRRIPWGRFTFHPALPHPSKIPRAKHGGHISTLTLIAIFIGFVIAILPLPHSLLFLSAAILVAASIWEPVIGLGLAIVLGPVKAYLAIARPDLPSDLGQIFFALAVGGWLARGLAQRRIVIPRIGLLLPLSLYISVSLFSLLSAISLEEGLREALKWIEIALGMVILVSEAQRGRVGWIIAAVLMAGIIQAALGIWQFQFRGTGPEHFRILGDHYRAYGTFEQPNPYGGFLGLIWPIAVGLAIGVVSTRHKAKSRLLTAFCLLLTAFFILAALYLSFSRGAWLGAAVAAVVIAIALPRRLSLGIGLVVVGLAFGWGLARTGLLPASVTARFADIAAPLATVTDVRGVNINDANFAIVERLAHWQAAQAMAQAKPWLGVGMGNYAAAYPAFRLLNWEHPLGHAHMIYLNVLAETGVLGLMTYVILWIAIIGLTIRVANRAAGLPRGLALGLLGAWAHFSAHQIVDHLYVNNLHFLIAALLALLVYIADQRKDPGLGSYD